MYAAPTMITQNLIFLTISSLLILSLHNFFETGEANCTPSACGIIRNISSPFRLKGDPNHCGYPSFELACENNVTSLYLNSHKYYVKAINYSNNGYYDNSTIRLVDASINNNDICSFPNYSTYAYNFTYYDRLRNYQIPSYSSYPYDDKPFPINFIGCPNPLTNSSLFTDITTHCASNSSYPRYAYIKVGHLNASELPHLCVVEVIVMTSWHFRDLNNVSLSEIHHSLLYGFELTTCIQCATLSTWSVKFTDFLFEFLSILVVIVGLLCAVASPPVFTIFGFAALALLLYFTASALLDMIYNAVVVPNPSIELVIGALLIYAVVASYYFKL